MMVQKLMKLCFLMERQYAPYSKWFGTKFARLAGAEQLTPIFRSILRANSWRQREECLSSAYQIIAQMHNNLLTTKPLSTSVANYYDRPYLVIHANRFAEAIRNVIGDREIKNLPFIGSIDQFSNVDLLTQSQYKKFKTIFTLN